MEISYSITPAANATTMPVPATRLPPTITVRTPSKLEEAAEARIDKGEVDLPVFPSSAQEVLALCESPDVDARKLAAVIRRDATLAGHFLALANSPAFGARVQLVSLQQALTRLGLLQTRQIAVVVACKAQAFVVPGHPERESEILGHALGTALYAQEIARIKRWNVEEAFLCGLLHDIGRPAMLQLCFELDKGRTHPDEVEACATRFHQRVGGMIATRWALPRSVVDVIESHHSGPDATTTARVATGIAIVQLADELVRADSGPETLALHPATNALNLYPDDIEALIAKRTVFQEQLAGIR